MADYPENFQYNSETNTLSWNPVEGAEQYLIERQDSEVSPWITEYEGPEFFCHRNYYSGTYFFKGKMKKVDWGGYGPAEKVLVP